MESVRIENYFSRISVIQLRKYAAAQRVRHNRLAGVPEYQPLVHDVPAAIAEAIAEPLPESGAQVQTVPMVEADYFPNLDVILHDVLGTIGELSVKVFREVYR
ncbi:MAG: hypothetical protein MMC23_004220 [Stictis urceolatum]|nr:hypothetical protein [Stictis urceolata]